MATERNVVDFKIHNLTEEQFQELKAQGKIDPNAVYCTPDESLKTSQITNCITELPQTVKYTFENGVLTILAGTVAYLPNGVGVFNKLTTTRDITLSFASINAANEDIMIFVDSSANATIARLIRKSSSGTTNPELTYSAWYDTTNNIINDYGSDVTTPIRQASLPILTLKTGADTITEITQVFNGLGYIGSTMFVLPGVKGLIPNGRNEDGTLKNIVANNTSVKTVTKTDAYSAIIAVAENGSPDGYTALNYYPEQNMIVNSTGALTKRLNAGTVIFGTGGKITSFEPKQAFHAVDYNDYQNTVDSISAVDSSAVHKTGDETVGGAKTFTGRIRVESSNNEIKFINPGNSAFDGFVRTSSTGFAIGTQKDGAWKKTIVLTDTTATAPTPASSSNSTEIATTAWVRDLFETLYPVGSLYISTGNSCPLTSIVKKSDGSNSTWALVAAGKALWTGNGTSGSGTTANDKFANAAANTTIAAGLPNITGSFGLANNENGNLQARPISGAFSQTSDASGTDVGTYDVYSSSSSRVVSFSAQNSNSIYGNSTTVQPPAYVVNVWRRTA